MSRRKQVLRVAAFVVQTVVLPAIIATAIVALLTRDDPALGVALIALAGSLALMWRELREP